MSAENKGTVAKEKESLLAKPAVQSILASLLCIIVGLAPAFSYPFFINDLWL